MKLSEIGSPVHGSQAYRTENNVTVICAKEPCGPQGQIRWHLSIAHNRRYPTWDEIRDIRYALVPDEVMVAMFLPPRREYVNQHPYCFHLFEVIESEVPSIII